MRFGNRGSLSVVIGGPEPGRWYDHEAGKGGDAVALVAHLRRCTMREAYRWSLDWLGVSARERRRPAQRRPQRPPERPRQPSEEERRRAALARRIWTEAAPAAGSLVERYLASRGLSLPADAPLRFHPTCRRGAERLPAMVALMTDPATGEPRGVHRTFLLPDGSGKVESDAKMMLGAAGVIRLVPDEEVAACLGIAEGIETSLALMQRFGWTPVWAAGSAGGIASFPVLAGIEALTIFPDADDSGASLKAARQCAGRWRAEGREVRHIAPPAGADFADLAGRAA
ncbi:toprim domain-containing protein [Belnapia sp. T18]|uniref:Toprim domain-containing protein n=1 Tax=Belnapia arida TaxID=2804533 RepID=A0ABS1UCT4_9PROT|nr:toprim domain-containing protein [Belnapia arida]MBL6082483.1 toprim domain-containing protein [Belnapia arida]